MKTLIPLICLNIISQTLYDNCQHIENTTYEQLLSDGAKATLQYYQYFHFITLMKILTKENEHPTDQIKISEQNYELLSKYTLTIKHNFLFRHKYNIINADYPVSLFRTDLYVALKMLMNTAAIRK